MTRAEEGLTDKSVQAAICLVHPDMVTRFNQINFFMQYTPGCSRLNIALRLAVYDLKGLGYLCDDGIREAGGKQLWPTS